ncbi:MAG: AI-2E family transporter [Actinobacteria bacterium]|nr:AI-2E family transporter [Actinomycetota bacterium]
MCSDGDGAKTVPRSRVTRAMDLAASHSVPIRTILVVDAVIIATLVAGWLVIQLREIILIVVVAGFVAMLLNPFVHMLQKVRIPRSVASIVVFLFGILVFLGLAFLFGYPLVKALTHFADGLPKLVTQVEHGKGKLGKLVAKYHVATWVKDNAPKIASAAKGLSAPALAAGKATLTAVVLLVTIAMLTLLILLEAPSIARGIMSNLQPRMVERIRQVGTQVERAVVGYMFGDVVTSLVAGAVMLVAMLVLGVPFAGLLALWVGLVDLLPLVGGLLAALPVVIIAAFHSIFAGLVTLVVFLVYQQLENHVLNPVVMSRTVRISPLWVLLAVLVGADLGDIVGSAAGAFFAALMAIPIAGAIQVVAKELWRSTGHVQEYDASKLDL